MKLYWITNLEAWEDLSRQCPGATWFHMAPWLGAIAEALDIPFNGVICEFGSDAVGLVPLLRRPLWAGLWAEGLSGASGGHAGYGGLISSAPLAPADVNAAFREIAQTLPDLRVTGNPHTDWPHLPDGDGLTTWGLGAHLVALQDGPAPAPVAANQDLVWSPQPPESQADMLCSLEPSRARRRRFYEALLRRADDGRLACLTLRENERPIAGILVGRGGAIAYNLGLFGPAQAQRVLLGYLPGYLGPRVEWLDMGPDAPPLGPGWRLDTKPFALWRRQSLPAKLLTSLRRPNRRAS